MQKSLIRLMALLLVVVPFLGAWANETSAASTRVAVIKELKGTVKVKKAGGSKEFTAFAKMSLNEGDVLSVGNGGSAVLQFANGTSDDDKMTVGDNTKLSFSKLSNKKGTTTKVSMWSGSAWVDVKSIANKDDQFTLETPTAVMGVRGTHFLTSVNPITGSTQLSVAAGIVAMTPPVPTGAVLPPPQLIYPSQSILTLPSGTRTPAIDPAPIDPSVLVGQAGPALIEAMLRASVQIQQENDRLMAQYVTDLGILQPDLDRIRNNIDNLVSIIVNQAVTASIIQQAAINSIQEELLRTIGQKIDLSIKEMQLTNEEKRKQEVQREAERKAREVAERIAREEAEKRNKELQEMIKQKQEEQKKAAEEAIKKKKDKAFSDYESQLDEAGKKRLQDAKRNLTQGQVNIPGSNDSNGSNGNSGGGGGSSESNRAPTSLSLSETAVAENAAIGTTIGTFSAIDPDTGDTFTYSLVSGTGDTDNASFTISGTSLKTAIELNYETKASYSIRVRVTDSGGLWKEQSFTITVINDDYINPLKSLKVVHYIYNSEELSGSPSPVYDNIPLGDREYTYEETGAVSVLNLLLEKQEEDADLKVMVDGTPIDFYPTTVYDPEKEQYVTKIRAEVLLFDDANTITFDAKPNNVPATSANTKRFTLHVTKPPLSELFHFTTSTNPEKPVNWLINYDDEELTTKLTAYVEEPVSSLTFAPIVGSEIIDLTLSCENGTCDGLSVTDLQPGESYYLYLSTEGEELAITFVNGYEAPADSYWNNLFEESFTFIEDYNTDFPLTFTMESGVLTTVIDPSVDRLNVHTNEGARILGVWDEREWKFYENYDYMSCNEGPGFCFEDLEAGDNRYTFYLKDDNGIQTRGIEVNVRKGALPKGIISVTTATYSIEDVTYAPIAWNPVTNDELSELYGYYVHIDNELQNKVKLELTIDGTQISEVYFPDDYNDTHHVIPNEPNYQLSILLSDFEEGGWIDNGLHSYEMAVTDSSEVVRHYEFHVLVGERQPELGIYSVYGDSYNEWTARYAGDNKWIIPIPEGQSEYGMQLYLLNEPATVNIQGYSNYYNGESNYHQVGLEPEQVNQGTVTLRDVFTGESYAGYELIVYNGIFGLNFDDFALSDITDLQLPQVGILSYTAFDAVTFSTSETDKTLMGVYDANGDPVTPIEGVYTLMPAYGGRDYYIVVKDEVTGYIVPTKINVNVPL